MTSGKLFDVNVYVTGGYGELFERRGLLCWRATYYTLPQLLLIIFLIISILLFMCRYRISHFHISMSRTALTINLDTSEQTLLQTILRRRSIPEFQKERVQIVLAASTGLQNKDIARQYQLEENRVGVWRKRWGTAHQQWQASDENLRPTMNEVLVLSWFADKPGRGRKDDFTPEQKFNIAKLCQEPTEQHGFPVTHWSAERIAQAAVQRGIVATISARTVLRILKKKICPHTGVAIGLMPK
jgi:hypothetical protein